MMFPTQFQTDDWQARLGMGWVPMGGVPDALRDQMIREMNKLYAEIGFKAGTGLPDGWSSEVRSINGQSLPNGAVLLLIPATTTKTPWLRNNDRMAAWQALGASVSKARVALLDPWRSSEAKVAALAQAKAEWADLAYRVAKFLALPVTLAEEASKKFLDSSTIVVVALAGLGFLALKSMTKGK